MGKRRKAFWLILVWCLFLGRTVLAQEPHGARLVDMADILEDADERRLLQMLDEISMRHQLDIVIVTAGTLDKKTPMEYADDFYDTHDYGFGAEKDGVLLLVSMEDRDWWISTTGYGVTAFTDAGLGYISGQFLPMMGEGDYAGAFARFAELCDAFVTQARTGAPYDVGALPKAPFRVGYHVCAALLFGFIFAAITTAVMAAGMRTVRPQPSAQAYVKDGSMRVTDSRDLFLYAHTDRTKQQTDSGSRGGSKTHTASSGSSHGGRGGKF